MSYNKDIDYQEKIDEAVTAGDYKSAAQLEISRNEKIDSEKLPYKKTNHYSGWLDNTDYSLILRNDMDNGASKDKVAGTLKKRINKASGTRGLTQYAYDEVYDEAIKYIMGTSNFSYDISPPEFQNSYGNELERAYAQLSNMGEFDYDLYSDDLYKYYKAQYNREGQRAMQELLGELSMNTGGVASSYAVSAASQMLENYNKKLTDKIPELYEAAFERYLGEREAYSDEVLLLADLSDREYEQYLGKLGQYNTDRDFSYKVYSDAVEDEFIRQDNEFRKEQFDAQQAENERKWENEAREWADSAQEDEAEAERRQIEEAFEKWEMLGYLDEESAKILGLPAGLHTVNYDYKLAQQYKLYQ